MCFHLRLPAEALHLARISKLLTAISSNNVESIRGKSLDELPMPDRDTTVEYLISEDSPNEDDCDDEESDDHLDIATIDEATQQPDVSLKSTFVEFDNEPGTSTAETKRLPKVRRKTNVPKSKPGSRILTINGHVRHCVSAFFIIMLVFLNMLISNVSNVPFYFQIPWTAEEKDAVLRHLASCVHEGRPPVKAEVIACMAREPILRSRSWKNVKDYVRNLGVSWKRRSNRNQKELPG